MLIIADRSALIALAVCDGLQLLDRLFGVIRVPAAVYEEVIVDDKPASDRLKIYIADKSVPVDITRFVIAAGGLGQGECEAMALYKMLNADYLLIDDQRARKIAILNQITITGSLGILLLAKHEGLISKIAPLLDRLRTIDIHFSEKLLFQALTLAGETDSTPHP